MVIKNFFENYFLYKYENASFMTRQRAAVFMWMQIVFICLMALAQTSTNILSPEVATPFYNVSMLIITAGFAACLFILKTGAYKTAAYSGILLPLFLVTAQALQVNTVTGKYTYILFLMIFIVMASLFGTRITIISVTVMVVFAGVLIIQKSGSIIPVERHGSSMANMAIASMFISVLCMLTLKIVKATIDEVEKKNADLEQSLDEINAILKTCSSVATTLNSTAEDLSANAAEFSVSAQTQAAGVEEISSTMEELLASVSQNADSSAEAEILSEKSYRLAGEGTEVVNSAVSAINDVNESSKKILEIINLINDIAFQTNLLALNASVEAARAGESGRGFAVVASEVRNLAQRSRSASDDINRLIKASVEKVSTGTDLVNKSGRALKEIFNSIEQTRKIIAELNSVSREQKEGLGQLTLSLNQADTVSQQTAAAAEELFSSSEQLKQNSSQLQELMSFNRSGNM